METHQKDIEEKDPFGQNRDEADEADEAGNDEKSFLKALLAERALKKGKHQTPIRTHSLEKNLTTFLNSERLELVKRKVTN